MDGITILDTYNYVNPGSIIGFLGFGASFICLAIVAGIWFFKKLRTEAIACVIISIISLAIAVAIHHFTPEPTTRYKVVVDDSVSFTEFNEKYKVINIEGKIYTIEERVD